MDIEKAFESIQNNLIVTRERGAKGGIFSIVEGGWEAAIETLPKTVANAFDCTINELDYCILHFIKDDKVVTIDFKGML